MTDRHTRRHPPASAPSRIGGEFLKHRRPAPRPLGRRAGPPGIPRRGAPRQHRASLPRRHAHLLRRHADGGGDPLPVPGDRRAQLPDHQPHHGFRRRRAAGRVARGHGRRDPRHQEPRLHPGHRHRRTARRCFASAASTRSGRSATTRTRATPSASCLPPPPEGNDHDPARRHHRRHHRLGAAQEGQARRPGHAGRADRSRRTRPSRPGASLVHIHVRNADESSGSDPAKFAEVQEGVRKHCPGMIVQFSTGGRGREASQRGAMLYLKPGHGLARHRLGQLRDDHLREPARLHRRAREGRCSSTTSSRRSRSSTSRCSTTRRTS